MGIRSAERNTDHIRSPTSIRRVTFNPEEVANNMKANGGFIPGIRPGQADRRLFKQSNVKNHYCRSDIP